MSITDNILGLLGVSRNKETDKDRDVRYSDENTTNPYEATDADSLVNFVQTEFKRREMERLPYELQWRLNIAFIEGNQYLDVNPVALTIEEVPKLYWWQEREVFNHIAPNIEVRIARLSKMRPQLKARPSSNDKDDLRRTRVTNQLINNIYYDNRIKDKILDLIPWLEATGTVLFKNHWNPNAGPVIVVRDESDGKVVEYAIREGDLEVTLCPAVEIYPDSCLHQEVTDCKSIIHAKAYHVDDIKDIWGVEVTPETSAVWRLTQSVLGQGGLGVTGGYKYTTQYVKDTAIVKEYWEMPSKRWPEGRLIIVANGKLLYFGPNPYRVGPDGQIGLPFTKVVCIKRPGVFWGKTVVERLIPIQRRYNALRNRKAEFLNNCSIGGWLVEENSVDLDQWEENAGSPGFIGVYRPGTNPPIRIQNNSLPQEFESEEAVLLQEFSILSGVSELSRQSKAPTGVKSGVALSIALEQDETRLSATALNIEEFLVESAIQWLRLYKQFVNSYRILNVVGKNNIVDVFEWTGSDLKADDIIIEPITSLSETPAQRRQMVFDLLTAGLFIDPDTGRIDKNIRHKILETLEMGNWEDIDAEDELHIAKAERENRLLAGMQGVMPMPYDNHDLHIKLHNEYRLTSDYEMLKTEMPQVEQIFEAHIAAHNQYILQRQQMLMQLQAPQGEKQVAK